MSVRDDVIVIDEMSEEDLHALERYARYLNSGAHGDFLTWVLDNAPEDDEPTTPEEDRLADEAWQEYQRGEAMSADVARQILGRGGAVVLSP